ncbi:MAG: selenobiotic family peptide radical SAM maturase [Deltaproteobacteria bacterium]|nr:selenobiotic family peptide radical SAM maturase [Deltaproteobacteria bacterium]
MPSFPLTESILGGGLAGPDTSEDKHFDDPKRFIEMLDGRSVDPGSARTFPDFLPDLARLEWLRYRVESQGGAAFEPVDEPCVNPTMEIERLSWDLTQVIESGFTSPPSSPVHEEWWVLGWLDPASGEPVFKGATQEDLLALKLVAEGGDRAEHAAAAGVTVGALDSVIRRAVDRGILVAPKSRIRRDPHGFPGARDTPERFLVAQVFTLQWHITHQCELHCRHCYDRTLPSPLTLEDGLRILDDLRTFCWDRGVQGQVCFTGGNPLLHPDFMALYRAASDRGFSLSILGNPTSKSVLRKILDIQRPDYYQVSLEGLAEHNDHMRGAGHFNRVLGFLDALRDLEIDSQVMLTLTRDNLDQVIELAGMLKGRVDDFTFNRLAQVGEGADIALPDRDSYAAFLEAYVDAARANPAIAWKDNLLNIVRDHREMGPFGGCTGFGCGAAFNFVAVLPDGEVHACRKFPSPLGNIPRQTIADVYDSPLAGRYRRGSDACRSCALRPTCGGCMAVVHGQGLDVFRDLDPMCFY